MTTLIFLAALAALIVFILSIEGGGDSRERVERNSGLLTWLTTGNWPAKVGGALMVVGVGALLRYAALNIEIPPVYKLMSGVLIAFALWLASAFIPNGAAKRQVSLALGGAAFGVAYLTAYSAFALFGYLSHAIGIALLAITAAGACVYALSRSAMSLAILAMVGTFLAPAFAVGDPGPLIVYGYYAFASVLTLVMVAIRGWRPLIHLSFLFTLVGGIFFAWTAQYYVAPNARLMLFIVPLLSAIHVAMPIFERSASRSAWLDRMDTFYIFALPTTVAFLGFLVASTRVELSIELMALGVIWGAAAVLSMLMSRPSVAIHSVVALALFFLGLIIRFQDIPWELGLLSLSVTTLAIVARRDPSPTKIHNLLAGFALLFGALHILSTNASPVVPADPFINGVFLERLVAATLLIIAGTICRKIKQSLDTLLLTVGILWFFISVSFELIRTDFANAGVIAHWFAILVAASLWIPGRRVRIADKHTTLLLSVLVVTAWWASVGASATIIAISALAATVVTMGTALRPEDENHDEGRIGGALVAPILAFIWLSQYPMTNELSRSYFAVTISALVAIATLFAGRLAIQRGRRLLNSIIDVLSVTFAFFLVKETLFTIVRDNWAVTFEVTCLAGILTTTYFRRWLGRTADFSVAMSLIGCALVLQTMLLRMFGPDRNLDLSDLFGLKWPAVISLLWALAGCALTIWARRVGSRALWSGGSLLLVAAALKLVLVDFGSLGQLANILAVIAAGCAFLLVGWLAPIPPSSDAAQKTLTIDADPDALQGRRKSWSIALVLILIIASSESTASLSNLFAYMHARKPETTRPTDQYVGAPEVQESVDNKPPIDNVAPAPMIEVQPQPTEPTEHAPEKVSREQVADTSDTTTQKTASVDSKARHASSAMVESAAPAAYKPPPNVDANGVPTFTQYSMPQSTVKPADRDAMPPGKDGIEQLLNDGRLRKAFRSDLQAWLDATANEQPLQVGRVPVNRGSLASIGNESSRSPYLFRTYVVIGQFRFPSELYGANSVTFIVPKGTPLPTGDPGHSRVMIYP